MSHFRSPQPPTPTPGWATDYDGRETYCVAGAVFRSYRRAVRNANGIASAIDIGSPDLTTDGRANASAYQHVRADTLGDLRADAGDDKRALLHADHGHLRAELYAVGHGRADERVKKSTKAPPPHHHYRQHRTDQRPSPRYDHPTIPRCADGHGPDAIARDIIIALIGRIGAASTTRSLSPFDAG